MTIIPTCTSGVSSIPSWHQALFEGHEGLLNSAKAWSPGAMNLAQGIAMAVHTPLTSANYSQLLIDLSRHPNSEKRFSSFSKKLTEKQREKLDEQEQKKFLDLLDSRLTPPLNRKENTLHLAVDTQVLEGNTALCFHYSPTHADEAELVRKWINLLEATLPGILIQKNEAAEENLQLYIREKYPETKSIGITLNQNCFLDSQPYPWQILRRAVLNTVLRLGS